MAVVDPFISSLNQRIEILMRRSMRSFMRYAGDSAISISRFVVLFQMVKYRVSGIVHLEDYPGLSSAAVSQLLERIIHQGLILRSEDPNDWRVE